MHCLPLLLQEKFYKANGIRALSDVLALRNEEDSSETNDKIIEVILSILGNCTCNNEHCANQVKNYFEVLLLQLLIKEILQAFESQIIGHVVGILNKSDNSSILGKACRLIGNLAQFQKIAFELQAKGVALSTSNCLSDDASPTVLTMAIRAIRLMWNSKRFRNEILSFGSIYKIMVILFKMLKNNNEKIEDVEPESEFVILKRQHEPDRAISKEKLSLLIEKMEKHEVEINYEIMKPERRKDDTFNMPIEKENVELVSGILKCLLSITATLSTQVARSVYADGFGISCLMFLAGETSKYRSMALKIISNLSSNPLAQEYLAINNDLVIDISNLLLNSATLQKPLDLSEMKYCLNILCLSSENACNRGKLRRSGVFKSLLTIANTTKCEKELSLLIFVFYQFRFDQLGLDNLLELGFINVMIKILADLIEVKEVDHIKFDDPSLDEERKEDQKQKQKKRSMVEQPAGFNNFSKFMRYDPGSPSSSSSGYTSNQQFSPSRCSGYSPFNSPTRECQDADDSDSDIYSPVCSDHEEEAPKKDFDILAYIYENDEIGASEKSKTNENMDIDDDASNLTLHADEHPEAEHEGDKAEGSKRSENIPETLKLIEADPVQHILQLLWKVSIKNSDATSFVRPGNLVVLHKVSKLVQRPNGKIFQILDNILVQTRNFVPILKQDFVFKLHELSRPPYEHPECYSCSKMKSISKELLQSYGSVAESGYGRGEFAHFLLTGDDEMKKKIAVLLTFIISCPEILNDLLFRHKALDIVMDIILNQLNLAAEACDGLTVMANNLNIQIPSDDDVLQRIIPDEYVEDESLLESEGEKIKFVLKDGEAMFDKETLMSASEVFHSMLSGDFRESNFNEVRFPDYTVEGMKYFFQLVKMDQNGKLKPIAPLLNDMNVILQAYELSILYILTNIQKPLLNVIKIVLDETSVLKIFEWSLRNINQDLLISAICYFLCGNIEGKLKLKLFLEASQSQYSSQWKQLIVDTILMRCQPSLLTDC